MNEEQWEVRIQQLGHCLLSQVYIYRVIGREWIEFIEIKSPEVSVHRVKYEPTVSENLVKPTFSCRPDDALGIAKGFIAYANSQGFKNGTETFVKGKLEATENHLADMRKLLKLR